MVTAALPIAPYKSLDPNAFFDLASPAILDGAIRGYANVPPYYSYKTSKGAPAMVAAQSGAVIYGREHVYEQSMSSLFIDYLHQFPEVWNVSGVRNFCTWAHSNLWTVPPYMPAGSRAVVEDIGLCYPSLANSRAAGIPVLEQNANIDKNSAFYYPERALDPGLKDEPSIVNEDDFASECPTLQVARLRTIAMITPFMNSLPARDAFEQTNDCIRGVYQDWYPKYAASVNNVVPLPAGFISEYNAWVKVIVSGLRPAVITEMDTLIPLYNNKLTTPTEVKLTTNPVLTEWANLSPRPAAGAAWVPTKNLNTATINANLISVQNVSRADLQTLRNNVPDITWISTLP
ncbi:hypothetical protein C8R47DRAFT_123824 [Mycena vitilis]|nr:hypothetical protein C8R47DRAFT_123824 [Mycena vitilis]